MSNLLHYNNSCIIRIPFQTKKIPYRDYGFKVKIRPNPKITRFLTSLSIGAKIKYTARKTALKNNNISLAESIDTTVLGRFSDDAISFIPDSFKP